MSPQGAAGSLACPPMNEPSPETTLLRVEAARYAVLRRLSAAMRHQLVMHLQPIGMVSEVLARRLRAPTPDLGQVSDGVGKINAYAKVAVQASLDLVGWLAPDPAATQPLDAGVGEAMELLRSNFGFRGYSLRPEVEGVAQPVGRSALRMLLPAALLVLSDEARAPSEIVIRAEADAYTATVTLEVVPGEGPFDGADPPYRLLRWPELEALAGADDVRATRTPSGATLVFNVLE